MASQNVLALTDESFDSHVLSPGTVAVVDFWAAWCMPCKMLAPVIDDLANEYAGRVVVAHLDLYRLERERELDDIGFDDLLDRPDVAAVIEWADRFAHRLPRDHLRIELAHAGAARALTATATGPRSAALLAAWTAEAS